MFAGDRIDFYDCARYELEVLVLVSHRFALIFMPCPCKTLVLSVINTQFALEHRMGVGLEWRDSDDVVIRTNREHNSRLLGLFVRDQSEHYDLY